MKNLSWLDPVDLHLLIRTVQLEMAHNNSRINGVPEHVCLPAPWNARYLMPGGAPELDIRLRLRDIYQSGLQRQGSR